MREVLIYFLLNNAASYLKESSVDKLYVSIFAICNSEAQFHSLLSRYFPDLSKNISPLAPLICSLAIRRLPPSGGALNGQIER